MKNKTPVSIALILSLISLFLVSCGISSVPINQQKYLSEQEFILKLQGTSTRKLAFIIGDGLESYYKISPLDKSEIEKIGVDNISGGSVYASMAWSPTGEEVAVPVMGVSKSGLQIYNLKSHKSENYSDPGIFFFL